MARSPRVCTFYHDAELGGSGGKKVQGHMGSTFLNRALEAFSGYVAADELYEGPFCMLSAVDNRQYKRMRYAVLDRDPHHARRFPG
jgi:hypothetical protein